MEETHQFLIKLMEEKDANNAIRYKAVLKSQETGFDLMAKELREIKELKKEQNGRISKLENMTLIKLFSWIQENPRTSGFLIFIGWLGVKTLKNFVTLEMILNRLMT